MKFSLELVKPYFKNYLTIGFIFSLLITVIVLWRFLFTQGIVEWNDIEYPYNMRNLIVGFNTWNKFVSADTAYMLYMYILSWLAIPFSPNGAVFERILYFLTFFSASYFIFLVVFKEIKRIGAGNTSSYISAATASIIYILNPTLYSKVGGGVHNLVSYSFAPLVFYFSCNVVNAQTYRQVVRYSLILALFQALSFAAPFTFLPNFVFMCLIILMEITLAFIIGKETKRRMVLSGVISVVVATVFSVLLMGFTLLPLTLVGQSFSSGPLGNYYANLIFDVPLTDAVRLFPATNNPLTWHLPTFVAVIGWNLSTFIIPFLLLIIAPIISLFIWISHRRHHLALSKQFITSVASMYVVAFISIFLAKGRNFPLGELYNFLALRVPFGWLLRYPEVWLIYGAFSYAVLGGMLIGVCHHYGLKWHIRLVLRGIGRSFKGVKISLSILFLIIVISSSAFANFLMLTGDVGGMLSPAESPKTYKDANQWLLEKPDWFRVFWMQTFSPPPWMPSAHPIGGWLSPMPIASEWVHTQGNFVNFARTYASSIDSMSMGKSLGLFGVKYIILYKDEPTSYSTLLELIRNQGNIREVYDNGDITIFENGDATPYIRGLTATNLILNYGSLDSMFLLNLTDFDPKDYAIVFPEQQMGLANFFLNDFSGGNVLIYNKNFTDLLFSTLEEKWFLEPQNYMNYATMNENWRLQAESSNNLIHIGRDETYSKGLLYGDGTFVMPFSTNDSGTYELWVRLPPYQQNFAVFIDEKQSAIMQMTEELVRTYSPSYLWLKLVNIDLQTGKHELKIESSSNAKINLFAMIPTGMLKDRQHLLFKAFEETNKTVTYMYDRRYINSLSQQIPVPLYKDTFTAYPLGDFNSSNWDVGNGNWSIQQLGNLRTLTQSAEGSSSSVAILKNVTVSDSVIEVDAMYRGLAFSILARYINDSQFYQFHYTHQFDSLQIWKQNGNKTYRLADSTAAGNPIKLVEGQWYRLKIELLGNQLKFYVNGTKYLDTIDNTPEGVYTQGSFGFDTISSVASFTDLSIQSMSQRFSVITPTASNYTFAFLPSRDVAGAGDFGNNILMIDNASLTLIGDLDASGWIYTKPLWLDYGNHNITILSGPDIGKLALYSASGKNATLKDIFAQTHSQLVPSYEEIDQTKYVVKLNLSEPVILTYSESYNDLWKANSDREEFSSFPLYTQINGFYINRTGELTLTIEYSPQKYFTLGKTVSMGAALFLGTYLAIDLLIFALDSRKGRRNVLETKDHDVNTVTITKSTL